MNHYTQNITLTTLKIYATLYQIAVLFLISSNENIQVEPQIRQGMCPCTPVLFIFRL
jgi:hypothetical protein